MTDEELRNLLTQADALLRQYTEVAKMAGRELARRHSLAVGAEYEGQLGCYTAGLDTICLHRSGKDLIKRPDKYSLNLSFKSRDVLDRQFFHGLHLVHLSGFY